MEVNSVHRAWAESYLIALMSCLTLSLTICMFKYMQYEWPDAIKKSFIETEFKKMSEKNSKSMSSLSKEMRVQTPHTSRESAFVAFSFVKIKHLRCSNQNLRENASVSVNFRALGCCVPKTRDAGSLLRAPWSSLSLTRSVSWAEQNHYDLVLLYWKTMSKSNSNLWGQFDGNNLIHWSFFD